VSAHHNVGNIYTTGEHHIYHEPCHACMARPLAGQQAPTVAGPAERIIDAVVSGDQTDEEAL